MGRLVNTAAAAPLHPRVEIASRVHAANGNPPQAQDPAPIALLVKPTQAREAVPTHLAAFVHAASRQMVSQEPVRVPPVLTPSSRQHMETNIGNLHVGTVMPPKRTNAVAGTETRFLLSLFGEKGLCFEVPRSESFTRLSVRAWFVQMRTARLRRRWFGILEIVSR